VPTDDFNPSSGSNCAGDIHVIQEGTLGFWVQVLPGLEGPVPVRRAVLLPLEGRVVWQRQSCGRRNANFTEGHRRQAVHFDPFLPPLNWEI
jgi:hypothetical protein